MIQLHHFKNACHSLVIEALPIRHILYSARHLVKTKQDLLNILQVAIVLSPEPFEFFMEPFFSLSRLTNHLG